MDCKEFDNKISLYIDGELNSDDTKYFLEHSKKCLRCYRALENSEQMMLGFKELSHIKAPEDLSKNIIYALERETENNLDEEAQRDFNNNRKSQNKKGFKGQLGKGTSWVKKLSVAAVLLMVLTSALIFSRDWIPIPMEEEMRVMENMEESAIEDSALDESQEVSSQNENSELEDSEESVGITALEGEEDASKELISRDVDEDSPLIPEQNQWIVILLGIGVISGIVVLLKNRKS